MGRGRRFSCAPMLLICRFVGFVGFVVFCWLVDSIGFLASAVLTVLFLSVLFFFCFDCFRWICCCFIDVVYVGLLLVLFVVGLMILMVFMI